jgi:hypothetical protein
VHIIVHAATNVATSTKASENMQDNLHGEGELYVAVAVLGGTRTTPPPRTFILFAYCKAPHHHLSARQLYDDSSTYLIHVVAKSSQALPERQSQSWRPLVAHRQFTCHSTSNSSTILRCRATCQAERTGICPASTPRCSHA